MNSTSLPHNPNSTPISNPDPSLPGTLTFLCNVEACPVAIFFCQADTSVLRFEKDTPLKLTDDIVAVAKFILILGLS